MTNNDKKICMLLPIIDTVTVKYKFAKIEKSVFDEILNTTIDSYLYNNICITYFMELLERNLDRYIYDMCHYSNKNYELINEYIKYNVYYSNDVYDSYEQIYKLIKIIDNLNYYPLYRQYKSIIKKNNNFRVILRNIIANDYRVLNDSKYSELLKNEVFISFIDVYCYIIRKDINSFFKNNLNYNINTNDQLIKDNIEFIVGIANSFKYTRLSVEDLIQDGLVSLVETKNNYKMESRVKLQKQITNCVIQYIIKVASQSKKIKDNINIQKNDLIDDETINNIILKEDINIMLDNCDLTENEKSIIILRFGLNGNKRYDCEEISNILDIKIDNVYRCINRGIKKIKLAGECENNTYRDKKKIKQSFI